MKRAVEPWFETFVKEETEKGILKKKQKEEKERKKAEEQKLEEEKKEKEEKEKKAQKTDELLYGPVLPPNSEDKKDKDSADEYSDGLDQIEEKKPILQKAAILQPRLLMKQDEKSSQKNRVTFNEEENIITPFRKTDKIEARKRKNLSVQLERDTKVEAKENDGEEQDEGWTTTKKRKVADSDSEESQELESPATPVPNVPAKKDVASFLQEVKQET